METSFWQLLLAAEVSPTKARALIRALGPLASITREEFAGAPELAGREADRVRNCNLAAPGAAGASAIHGDDLPPALRDLPEPPVAIFALGETAALFEPCVAIVGTRNASTYGRAVARRFGAELALGGATVVSGGAVGIDAAAHEGALSVEGRTVAVLAGGVDRPYPSQNAGLFRRMRSRGCQISAYACGTRAERHKFVERNELIAGLSRAVVVVEAPDQSGALITALAARRISRPVFVVPANIEAGSFRGSHRLIQTGSMLVDDPALVLAELGLRSVAQTVAHEPLSELAARIVAGLTTAPISAEKLADAVGLGPQELLAELTMLELEGRVLREPGGYALVP